MAKSASESKIPIFHTNQLKSRISKPLSSLSSRLRAHLDNKNRSTVLLGILGGNVKSVKVSQAVAVSHLNKSHQEAPSIDKKLIRRPTNIFTSDHRFPSATSQQHQHRDLSVSRVEDVGKRVRLNSGKEGVLRFVGKTQFGEGVWCGVELDEEESGSDGTVNNVQYFSCAPNRGAFAPVSNVRLVCEEVHLDYFSDVSDSGPHSLLGITGDLECSQNDPDRNSISDMACRRSNSNLHQVSQTPTPNSSNSSCVASCEWKCNSLYSSSTSSLGLGNKGFLTSLDPFDVQISKQSSFEYDESLGILTPDQMAELTSCSAGGNLLGAGSCDDFRILTLQDGGMENGKSKCPSMDNIFTLDEVPETLVKLLNETDTFIMSTSFINDQPDPAKDRTLRTPSIEQLPEIDLSSTLIADEQLDVVDVIVPVPSANFVTSVTSIGSWDNGYQGDGECSRPTSRGPDSSSSKVKVQSKGLEPMTDSDFFTESEADLYEDISCSNRDRKARVIDGKLFGSQNSTQMTTSQSCNHILSNELFSGQKERSMTEEMDSSGIYSDFDKKSDVLERTTVEIGDVHMPDEAQSDESPKSFQSVSSQRLVSERKEPLEVCEKMVQGLKVKRATVKLTKTISANIENNLKRRNDNLVKGKDCSKLTSSPSANKHKVPRRNVTSKVKSMMATSASSKCYENQENKPNNEKSNTKKVGKWDSVLSKIEKSKVDDKMKNNKIKDAKSKVSSALKSSQNKLNKELVQPFLPTSNTMTKMPSLSSRQKENSSHRFKTRKSRNRMNVESPVQSIAVTAPVLSRMSSRNSSVTDISDSHLDISQHSLPAVVDAANFPENKKDSSPLCSPLNKNGVSTVPLQSLIVNTKDLKISNFSDSEKLAIKSHQIGSVSSLVEDSPSTTKVPGKMTYRKTLPKIAPLKDQNRLHSSNSTSVNGSCLIKSTLLRPLTSRPADVTCKMVKTKAKGAAPVTKINPLLSQLKHATNGMESFIILFQRLTTDMDVFALPYIKRDLNKYKVDWLDMKSKLEEANVSCRRLKEEIGIQKIMYEQKLEEVKTRHSAQLDKLSVLHKEELESCGDQYQNELNELEQKLRNQETALHSKFDDKLRRIQRQAEERIEGILDEAKNQVDLLNLECDSWKERLIKESIRKVEEMETKFKDKMKRMETNHLNQLNDSEEKARKREELFLTPMMRKQTSNCGSGSDIISRSTVETTSFTLKPDIQNLEEEICSLRVVLDMKHLEIQDLRKQNELLRKDAQDLPFISQKLDLAHARVEDLNAQLESKIENEKSLLKENRKLLETIQYETEKKKRLSFQNEELLWKLKKSTQVAKTLAVFGGNMKNEEPESETPKTLNSLIRSSKTCRCRLSFNEKTIEKQLKRSRTDADIKLIESPQDGDASPKVLGVVEKNDSVSWVLEIDEPALAVASRMLRRANSLRGMPSIKTKSVSTQQSFTLPSRNKKSAATSPIEDIPSIENSLKVEEPRKNEEMRNGNLSELDSEGKVKPEASVSSFFDFMQDSDYDGDLLSNDENIFYSDVKGLTCDFSSSSESSLELEVYEPVTKNEYLKNGDQGMRKKRVTDSSSLSDTEDSESVDSFLTSSSAAIFNELVDSTSK